MDNETVTPSENQPLIPRSDTEKNNYNNRLKRIEGQVRGVQKMIADDRYCIDILAQVSAINAALKQVSLSLLEAHSKTCISNAIQSGHGDEYIQELMQVVQQFSK